ncbi:hypothetical protein FACS189485_00060 [Spirochaetia bacterium]|nr:hypothetical protein FACS189485_00060 [Spirochaetia bacterium]
MRALLIVIIITLFSGCSSLNSAKDSQYPENEKIDLRYPVILVQGLNIHEEIKDFDNWGRIPDVLRSAGIDLYFGNTRGIGTYETNAEILKNKIEEILLETNKEKVNIIGHSKGGLDARYLVWRYQLGDRVASVTMISTPHHGWEFADLLYEKSIANPRFEKNALKTFSRLYGAREEDIYEVIYQLTTKHMNAFNILVKSDEKVFYQTYYSAMRNAFDDLKYFYTFPYVKKISGKNDGIVSEKSAQWGNYFEIEGGISHDEIIDAKQRKISGVDIPMIYINIVKELSGKGF